MRDAAERILQARARQPSSSRAGISPGEESIDLLCMRGGEVRLAAPRLDVRHTHGTGCTFAAAIAARLALRSTHWTKRRAVPKNTSPARCVMASTSAAAISRSDISGKHDDFTIRCSLRHHRARRCALARRHRADHRDDGPVLRVHPARRLSTSRCSAREIAGGLSLGILLGAMVIVASWVLIWIYTRWANTHYDREVARLRRARCVDERRDSDRTGIAQPHRHCRFSDFRQRHAVHHLLGVAAHQDDRALLRRRPEHHRLSERVGAGRRLHERGQLPGHRGPRGAVRIRRADLFDRLPGRLADRHVPDRRAAAQSRPLHLHRCRRHATAPGARARRFGDGLARGRGLLSHRADGGGWQPGAAALRARLRRRRSRLSAWSCSPTCCSAG